MPYSPSSSAVHGRTRFSSSMIASAICAAAAPGAYQADVPSSCTSSPPPFAVRWTSAVIRSSATSRRRGTPPTVVALTTGTIWSPCPPRTSAVTSFTDEPVSQAMKVANRAVSRMPAMPTTRSRGQLVDVERLALRQALLDVDEHDVGVVAQREHLCAGRADVAGAHDGDLPPAAHAWSFAISASATSLVPTAVGSLRDGFMS